MKLCQMDLKNTFLNGLIKEEFYVELPPRFESETFPQHAFKLKKALHGLKRASRIGYEKLSSFLLKMALNEERLTQLSFVKTMILSFF